MNSDNNNPKIGIAVVVVLIFAAGYAALLRDRTPSPPHPATGCYPGVHALNPNEAMAIFDTANDANGTEIMIVGGKNDVLPSGSGHSFGAVPPDCTRPWVILKSPSSGVVAIVLWKGKEQEFHFTGIPAPIGGSFTVSFPSADEAKIELPQGVMAAKSTK